MKQALRCLHFALVFALLFVSGAVYRLLRDSSALVKQSTALVTEANTRMVGTSQNLNAVLIQVGLVADNVRRASESQHAVSTKTLAMLDNVNTLLKRTQDNADTITLHTVQTMDDFKPVLDQLAITTKEVNALVANDNIPQTLSNLNETSKQAAATMTQATATMGHVDAMTDEAQGWLHQELKPPSLAKRIYNTVVSTLIVAAHFL
jgi:ABC-type transporter Mla subunit MlaD